MRRTTYTRVGFTLSSLLLLALATSCSEKEPGPQPLTVERPLHLEEHLDAATIMGAEPPTEEPVSMEWMFGEGTLEWKALEHFNPELPPPLIEQSDGVLRVSLTEAHRDPREDRLHGDIYVELPDLTRADWSHVLVRARTSEKIRNLLIGFNLISPDAVEEDVGPFRFWGDEIPVVNDGTVRTYRLRADWSPKSLGKFEEPWQELAFAVNASEPASIDILSITLVPKAAVYADKAVAVRSEVRDYSQRRALFMHVPGEIGYRVQLPAAARLDVGLGVLHDNVPVTFRVSATVENGESVLLFEESYADREQWAQRSIDLSVLAGRTVTLKLETDAEEPGAVAFWGAPTLGSQRTSAKPNVIFYVLDGGGADYMSVYGYNRRTTPNMERLAAEGVVFERAYSNSSWSKPSTTSFMTSLHNSVLGNTKGRFDPLPAEALTMAEHFHRAGFQTAVFTTNAWAGTMSSLDRGVDVLRDAGIENDSLSSTVLHEDFWHWREAYPGTPYWVHFQTTDTHAEGGSAGPGVPFAGMFISPDQERLWREWGERLEEAGGDHEPYGDAFEKAGVSRVDFFQLHQRILDQDMAHLDYELGRLVERLKARGEWENTLLIIGADHSIWAGADDMGIAMREELPPLWATPIFRPSISRVPLIFVWPGHIAGGQRFSQPVSMIDVLPTVLELVDLPQPEVLQGQSLVPLLLGKPGWEPRPVIFDQFQLDFPSGELFGLLEVVDGRWAASLWIGPELEDPENWGWGLTENRPTPLVLYDLWNDPFCLTSVHEEHPDLVEWYGAFLEGQWEAHQALAQQFTPGDEVALTPEQLETLRSLGYIQ